MEIEAVWDSQLRHSVLWASERDYRALICVYLIWEAKIAHGCDSCVCQHVEAKRALSQSCLRLMISINHTTYHKPPVAFINHATWVFPPTNTNNTPDMGGLYVRDSPLQPFF